MIKRFIIVFLIVLALIAIGLFVFLLKLSANMSLTVKMYDSIQELSKLDQCRIQEYTSADDRDTSGLEITGQYSGVFSYNGNSYEVFAYVFPNNETAQTYFERATGRHTRESWNYSCSGNGFSTQYIVYYKNCTYRVEGAKQKDCIDFVNWLSAEFSYTLLSNGKEAPLQ